MWASGESSVSTTICRAHATDPGRREGEKTGAMPNRQRVTQKDNILCDFIFLSCRALPSRLFFTAAVLLQMIRHPFLGRLTKSVPGQSRWFL
jgi:hypothetical protein